jgi:hypothetical protein
MKSRRSAAFGVTLSVVSCALVACGSDPAFVEQQSFQQKGSVTPAKDGLDATVDMGGQATTERPQTEGLKPEILETEGSAPSEVVDFEAPADSLAENETELVPKGSLGGMGSEEAPVSLQQSGGSASTSGATTVADVPERGGVKEDVKAPPANSIPMNIAFSQLRGDAAFTNCLGVQVNSGAAVAMGCNKDGDLLKNVAVSASPAPFCNMISLKFLSQGKTLVDSQTRFNMERIRIEKLSSTLLEIGLEDNTDTDFNDYIVRIEVPSTLKYFIQGTDVTNCD